MGHHGTVVRVEGKWAAWVSAPPTVGESLHLWVPSARAHPVSCIVESACDGTLSLRAFVDPNVQFAVGSPAEIARDAVVMGTGKVK